MPASIMFKYIITTRPPKVDLLLVRSETIGKRLRCLVSQTRYWRLGGSPLAAAVMAAPQVLSVVDVNGACVLAVAGRRLELRVGSWRISVHRVTD